MWWGSSARSQTPWLRVSLTRHIGVTTSLYYFYLVTTGVDFRESRRKERSFDWWCTASRMSMSWWLTTKASTTHTQYIIKCTPPPLPSRRSWIFCTKSFLISIIKKIESRISGVCDVKREACHTFISCMWCLFVVLFSYNVSFVCWYGRIIYGTSLDMRMFGVLWCFFLCDGGGRCHDSVEVDNWEIIGNRARGDERWFAY